MSSSVCRPSTCGVGAWAATRAYDLLGERTGRTTGLGSGYTAQWNRAGRLVSLSGTRNDAAHPPQLLGGARWFANGGLRQAERANGVGKPGTG